MSKIFPEKLTIEIPYLKMKPYFQKPQTIKKTPVIISIEGNIGAGKSTLLKLLQEKYTHDILFIQEPVDMWETVKDNGENILQKYYKDPAKYAFAFQILAFTTRLQLLKNAINTNCKVILMERSLDADYNVFAKMLADDHILEPIEFQIYEKMVNAEKKYFVDKIIWLNTSVEECMKRIQKRGRVGEETISEDYLRKCDLYHNKWIGSNAFILDEKRTDSVFDELETYF
jgi:deoxyadenosine/deoxycytidine kinase